MGKTGLTGGTRVSVTPEKRIPNKKKNIKSKDLSPFLPGNKRLLNEENEDNPETIDTSKSETDDTSHTNKYYSIEKVIDTKKLTMMTNTKRILRNTKTVMNVLIILNLQILCVMKILSTQPKKNKYRLNG